MAGTSATAAGRSARGFAVGVALVLSLLLPSPVSAVVTPTKLIDGPSADLVGDVDSAMAEDGSGGVVYLKRVDGRAHVFAASFKDGAWGPSQRVDVTNSFDSSWPRIAAGNDGRLLVTWVQEFGAQTDRIYSATMDPGAGGFQVPVPVDFNVGEATSTFPDLAMARGGQAYLAYNVITDTSSSNPPGYFGVDVRLARYSNRLWTPVGSRIDRNSTVPMRQPTAAIAPRVGVGVQGEAIVAWIEPDDEFVDRLWARRVFGGQTGIPLMVSPAAWDGLPLRGGVDAFALDVSGFGQGAAAFRQQPGQASALTAPRMMTNGIPNVFSTGADRFGTPLMADGGIAGGLGVPSIGVDREGRFIAGFGSGSATLLASGDNYAFRALEQVDTGVSGVGGEPESDLATTGAGVVAWRELRGGNTGVLRVQERRADGVAEATTRSAPGGGSVGAPELGGSGLGDAIVAWSQGTGTTRQVAAAVVNAPPDPFFVLLSDGWHNERRIPIAWDPAPHAIGGVTYSVSVDDEPVLEGVSGLGATLGKRESSNGRLRIQIFARDDAGQETGSLVGLLLVDRRPPKVKLRSNGRGVRVVVKDGGKRNASGVRSANVNFGDGQKAKASGKKGSSSKVSHTFAAPGIYAIVVKARDRAGNEVRERKRIKVG